MADMEADETEESSAQECYELLMGLKCTVERLLAVQSSNVWSTYGGFKRVSSNLEAILCHRIKSTQMYAPSDGVFWPFVRGLKWLQPGMTSTMERVGRSSLAASQGGKGQMWLRESLQDHSLSSQLHVLVNDPEHLHYHYQERAFLRSREYVEAMLICLHALESNTVAGLADINPKLPHKCSKPISVKRPRSGAGSSCSMDASLSYDSNQKSWSTPNLASSPPFSSLHFTDDSFGIHGGGMNLDRSISSSSTSAIASSNCHPPSSPPSFLLRSGTLPSPDDHDTYEGDPLMVVKYGISPPLRATSPATFTNAEENNVFGTEVQASKTFKTLKKCVSESGVDANQETEANFSSASKVATPTPKKIHMPLRNKPQDFLNTWHAGSDQRRASSEIKAKVQGGGKGHKRSQSDMGIGALKRNGVSVMNSAGYVNGEKPGAGNDKGQAGSGSGGERVVQKPVKVSLHGGESLLQPPAKGQTLMSYLSEQDFNCCALLERENAHFGISDVLISVFEQMKWEKVLRAQSLADNVSEEEESDDEINELKQRIRIRRRERLVEKANKFPANSDGMNDTNTTSSLFSASSPQSSHGFSSLSESSGESDGGDDQIELTFSGSDKSNLAKLKSTGLSLSMASLYSDAELKKSNQTAESRAVDRQSSEKSNFSAEAIAMSLLSQFSEKRLPKASELDWLVSETDAPQALLPLPNSYPVSPDDGENADLMRLGNQTKLRGNLEWAPPRPQIIFTVHPQEKRSVVLAKQKMRCAGCGTKTEPGFVKRLRYCEYMGKYFCQCCHSNETEVIPGRVITRWDFAPYCVSNFARDLLHKFHSQPLFHVDAINPSLYRKVRTLESVRDLRQQLGHLCTFLNICKRNVRWLAEMESLPKHWTEDDNLYSMEDFSVVRTGSMQSLLKGLVTEAIRHVDTCQLCQGLGFICEICQATDVIFPFQLQQVTLCPVCQACYHKSCFIPGKCPKCSRLELRRRRKAQISPTEAQQQQTVWEGGGGGGSGVTASNPQMSFS